MVLYTLGISLWACRMTTRKVWAHEYLATLVVVTDCSLVKYYFKRVCIYYADNFEGEKPSPTYEMNIRHMHLRGLKNVCRMYIIITVMSFTWSAYINIKTTHSQDPHFVIHPSILIGTSIAWGYRHLSNYLYPFGETDDPKCTRPRARGQGNVFDWRMK